MHLPTDFQPLKTSFPVAAEYLSKDITFLLEVSDSEYCTRMTLKLINTLRRNGFSTIEDVINATAKSIQLLKRVGDKSFYLLLGMLEALSVSRN